MTDWWDEVETEAIARGEEAKRLDADPAYQARMQAKRAEEFERGVRLGWWDKDGEPIPQESDAEDEGEDEE